MDRDNSTRRREHRRRRTLLGGAVLAPVLLIGCATLAPLAWQHDDSSTRARPVVPATGHVLDVRAFYPSEGRGERLLAEVADRAVWNKDSHTVMYGSTMSYSGSCPPVPSASLSASGVISLSLTSPPGATICTADARRTLVMIHGVTQRPRRLTVTDSARTVRMPVEPLTLMY